MNNDVMRIELPDFQEFMKTVVECVNLGYTELNLGREGYPDTFGGFMYTCQLSRPETGKQGNTQEPNKAEHRPNRGRPPKTSQNPRYDRGLTFGKNNPQQ